jgi:hypothetical protein
MSRRPGKSRWFAVLVIASAVLAALATLAIVAGLLGWFRSAVQVWVS